MSGTAVLGTVAAAVLAGNYFAWRGIKPREFFRTSPGEKNKKPIKVEITEEGDNIILKCSNVPIESLAISDDREEVEGRLQLAKESAHDFEEIKRQLQKEEAEKEEKKRQELVTPPQARWEAPTPSQAEEQRCNVKFTIKKRAAKVSVAESVLSEWENITITIPHEGEEDETKVDELKEFRQWGSTTPGHPELDIMKGIENTSGPLGQGHTMAVGAAIAERFLAARFGELFSHKIFTYISDGGVQEEISQGAGRLAGFLGLSNLIMFYD